VKILFPYEDTIVPTNGILLHTIQAGPENGPLVILLHGFPEFWYGWRKQIPALAGAGYRVVVPDQRGYNLSDKPSGMQAYRLNHMVDDVVGLIQAAGREKASVVGHDWGAAVAWGVAALHPERLERLAILNVPYPGVILREALLHPDQFLRSAYIYFFQLPGIPEAVLRNNDWDLLRRTLQRTSRPDTFTPADIEQYRQAWWRKGAMRGMLNWYRALVWYPPRLPARPRIDTPTLMLWGARDLALNRNLASASIELCSQGELIFFEEATHWVQHEESEKVNRLLTEFFRNRSKGRFSANGE
jgi:pimeloyl-ACP methyl ester carboxylesterase